MSDPESYDNLDEFIAAHDADGKAPEWPEEAPWMRSDDDAE